MALEAGSKLFTHPIYRHEDFEVILEYLTEIIASRDGSEQRRADRAVPRKEIAFTVQVANDCFSALWRDIMAAQRGPWAVPDHSRVLSATSAMTGAGTDIDVPSVPGWLTAGEIVILTDGARVEQRTVDSTTPSPPSVSFVEANTGGDWPIGTKITPALPGRLMPRLSGAREAKGKMVLDVRFDITPTLELQIDPPAAPQSFNSLELFTAAPRSVLPVRTAFLSQLESVDFGKGAVEFNEPIDFPITTVRLEYEPCDADAMTLIEDFFRRQRGRRGSFYMPTFAKDFRPIGTASSGTGVLKVAGDVTDFVASTVLKHIAIQYADLSWQALSISGMAPDGANTDISFSTNFSQDVSASTVRRISWLPRWRLESDRLVEGWRNGRADCALAARTLEDP